MQVLVLLMNSDEPARTNLGKWYPRIHQITGLKTPFYHTYCFGIGQSTEVLKITIHIHWCMSVMPKRV